MSAEFLLVNNLKLELLNPIQASETEIAIRINDVGFTRKPDKDIKNILRNLNPQQKLALTLTKLLPNKEEIIEVVYAVGCVSETVHHSFSIPPDADPTVFTLTVQRGCEDFPAQSWQAGTMIEARLTAEVLEHKTATKPLTEFGAVGTYAWLFSNKATVKAGDIVSGANVKFVENSYYSSPSIYCINPTTTKVPLGTWRAMMGNNLGASCYFGFLCVRVA